MFVTVQNDTESDSDSDSDVLNSTIRMGRNLKNALDIPVVPKLEIPLSVKAVISKIDRAQLSRAREDIYMQLNDIMNNVRRVINRYNFVDITSPSIRKSSFIEYKGTRRNNFLEKVATHSKSLDIREKTLVHLLAWFEEWNAVLSEITTLDLEEHHHWIAQMELLPETLKTIENNVKILCKTSMSFLEEKKKQKKKILSRGTLWKSWKDRVIKRPATAHALRPDQMISDQYATNTKVSEIQDMLQELTGTSMFNKLENNAIKYISSTVLNLSKALVMLNDELKVLNVQSSNMYVDETVKTEKELSLKIMQDLSEQNEMLQQKLQDAEEKFEQVLQSKLVTGQLFPTVITLKGGPSPQASMAKAGDTEDSMENILAKEFENVEDDPQRKGTKSTVIKWDTALSYTAQGEMTPATTEPPSKDITEDKKAPQKDDAAGQQRFQKRRQTKGPQPHETPEQSVSIGKGEQKVLETKPSQYYDLQSLEKKKKDTKLPFEMKWKAATDSKSQHTFSIEMKSQDGKGGTSTIGERARKVKPENLLGRGPTPLESKVEPTTESVGAESKSKMSSPEESDSIYDPLKLELKGKKHQVVPGTGKEEITEEKEMLSSSKQALPHILIKSHTKSTKDSFVSPDVKSEQVNLELFQKAVLAFLKKKIDNIGKPLDKESILKEEELLKKAEVEKLATIKAKTEEYFQKVAETVTKILRKYKDLKKEGQTGEKLLKQEKAISFMPGLPFQKTSISPKSELSSFLLNENIDPIVNNLIQTILAEKEREGDEKGQKKEKRKQKEYLEESQEKVSGKNLKHQVQEHLKKESYEMRGKYLEEKASRQMEGKQEQKQSEWQEEETWNEQKQRTQKWVKQDEKQKQRGEEEEQQKIRQQQLEERKQIGTEQGLPSEKSEEKMRRVQKELTHQDLKMVGHIDEEKQKPGKGIGDLKKQRQIKEKDEMKTKEKITEDLANMFTQSPVTLSPREKSLVKYDPQLSQKTKTRKNLKKLKSLLDGKHNVPVTPPTSTRPSPLSRTLPVSEQPLIAHSPVTPEQGQALGITVIPTQVPAMGITSVPKRSQSLGVAITPEQAQALRAFITPEYLAKLQIPSTPKQAHKLGTILTLEQVQAPGIPIMHQQAQVLRELVTSEQTQAMQIPMAKQAQIFGVPISQEETQSLNIALTAQQAQDFGITLTPQQAQQLGIPLTHQQAQTQGIILTPQQAQQLGIPLTPQQAQELGIPLTPQQAQIQGIPLTPQQSQHLGIPLTPQQSQQLGIPLTPQQAQQLGIPLTPQQAQQLGTPLTPQQSQQLGIPLTPQQAQTQGIPLTPQQAQQLGIPLTPQQAQELGIPLTPQQAQAFGTTVTQEQVEALQPPLTSGQIQSLQDHLAPDQAQELMPRVTPEKAHPQGITLTHEQAQALGITLTHEQAQALKIPLTEEQDWKLGVSVTPEKFRRASDVLSLQQFHARQVTPPTQQARAPRTSLTLEKPATWAPFTLRPLQGLASLPTGQSTTSRVPSSPRQSLPSSFPPAEKSSLLGVSLTPLQKPSPPLTQVPFAPEKYPGTLLSPQILPPSRQILGPEGLPTPGQTLTPEIPPMPEQLPVFGASPIPGQPTELEALSSRQLGIPGHHLTSQPPLISQTPLIPGKPLVSMVPSTSEQISRLQAPLSSSPLVPGASSIPGELLESRSSAFAEQSQISQPPATPEQMTYLQTPSPPGLHLSPWTLPGQAPPLGVCSTPMHPDTQWAPPAPGKPHGVLPSSITHERLAIISSLKSKPALVQLSPDIKVSQAPFTPKKVQISEVSEALEETQMLQDTFAMEASEGFQSYLTGYRTQTPQAPYIRGEAFRTLMKPKTTLPSLIIQQPKTPQIFPSEWDQKSWLPPIDKPWILPSVSGIKKPMMVPPSSPQELEEKRLFVDVEAQRKNLILLNQARKTSRLPLQQYITARNLIIETFHMDTVRLGYLFRKYVAYRLIQRARNNIIKRLKAIQNSGKGYETRNLYIMLSRLDDYQKKVMRVWTEKQKSLEQKQNQCLRKMIHLFRQLQEMYGLNLSQPMPLITGKKQIPSSPKFVQQPFLQLLIEEDKKSDIFKKFRRQDQLEAIWNADLSTSSYPITEKTSIHSLWAQLGGYPDIPKLLQLDIQSTFRKSLASIQAQSKKIPK